MNVLPSATSYDELAANFQWHIPTHYNIGVDICDKWAAREPERLALLHKLHDGTVQSFTFADLQRLSNQTANLLQAHGVQPGVRVAIMLPQAPETGYGHIAAYKMGAIAMPLFALFGTEALRYRLQNSGTKAIITNAIGAAKVMQIREELPELESVFSIDGATPGVIDFHDELQQHSEQFTPINTLAEDPALLIYTSGTTGPPKGALHVHRTLIGHLPGMEMSLSLFPQPGDRIWTPADWAWIGALYDVVIPAWHYGITVVSHRFDKFDPEAAFQLIEEFEIRNAFLPPTALKMMRGVKEPEKRWRLNMRSISSGGEALGAELLEWGRQTFGLTINEMYGQTECNLIVMTCATIMEAKPGFIGRAAPGHEIAIIDDKGQVLPPGVAGQIACKRPDPVMMVGVLAQSRSDGGQVYWRLAVDG